MEKDPEDKNKPLGVPILPYFARSLRPLILMLDCHYAPLQFGKISKEVILFKYIWITEVHKSLR